MQYHALALGEQAEVDVIACAGKPLYPGLRGHPRVRLHLLRDPWGAARPLGSGLLFWIAASVRLVLLTAQLAWRLGVSARRPDVVLVQNPPAIPTLALAYLIARLRGARWVIDWHNLGYEMLALRLGSAHRLVHLALRYERALGARADAHLCVSRAMKARLEEEWGLRDVRVFYDRPAEFAERSAGERRLELLSRLEARNSCRTRTGRSLSRRPAGPPTRISTFCSRR